MTTNTESTLLDIEPTADQVSKMARILRERANELEHLATRMRETKSFDYASEAMNVIVNTIPELRLDLLVARPVRVLDAVVRKLETE
jgi:hypothetical protein